MLGHGASGKVTPPFRENRRLMLWPSGRGWCWAPHGLRSGSRATINSVKVINML